MRRYILAGIVLLLFDATPVLGSADSIGPNGINSSGLALNGSGVDIGQVETRRPADPDFDTMSPLDFNSTVNPTEVFWRAPSSLTFTPTANNLTEFPSPHAVEVAGIMISTDTTAKGVAPAAHLYSVGINPTGTTAEQDYQQAAISANYLATLATQDIRAINLSVSVGLPSGNADATSTLTKFLDWSARAHDVLYSNGVYEMGPMGPVGGPIPSDDFNGITAAFSRKNGAKYRQVDENNILTGDDFGTRTFVDIIAPGRDIQLATQNNMVTSIPDPGRAGTSLAIPHVTGTVALLQQYADDRIDEGTLTPWLLGGATRHEVIKAVIMNSADKIEDTGSGKYLGMERTVLKQDGMSTWLNSTAHTDQTIPLDDEMGAGHLNASRALMQFSAGQYLASNASNRPKIAWDYGSTRNMGEIQKYRMGEIGAGVFISVTLAWDRVVNLNTDDGEYAVGDTLAVGGLTNLDLYLLPQGSTNINQAIWASKSTVSSVEHIFHEIPTTGNYEFWVYQQGALVIPTDVPFEDTFSYRQPYGLAWWTATRLNVTADFDNSGTVDAADLVQWKGDFGINNESDADNDGDSDGNDFLAWQRELGMTSATPTSAPVPEPAAWMLCVVGLPLLRRRRAA